MTQALPHDPVLPQLATALDSAAMAGVFGAVLHGPQVLACAVDRIKYRPRRNCSVSYRLQLRDAQRGDFEQGIAARFFGNSGSSDSAAQRHRQASERRWLASPAGPALQHEPGLDMLAFWLPNDPKLDALRLLCDGAELRRRCLPELVAALTASRGRLIDHTTTLVQVVPELRACARVELQLQAEPGAATSLRTLYVKANLERSGGAARAVLQALRDSPAHADGRLRTPRSVLWQPDAGLHWQAALPGRVLMDIDPTVGAETSAQVGRQLAALHAAPMPVALATLDPAALREQAVRAAALLGSVEPAWRPALTRLLERLERGAAWLAAAKLVTLHGDLHPRNILVDATRAGAPLAFIDLDDAQRGPAAIELGGWIADAHYRALLDGQPVAQLTATCATSCAAFLAAYADASGQRIDAAVLAWGAAHHLLCRRAAGGLASLKPGRLAAIPALLALAEAIARAGTVDAAVDSVREAA